MNEAKILGSRKLAKAVGISTSTLSKWWLETKDAADNPFEPGRPIRANVERLRQYALTRKAKGKNKPGKKSNVKRPGQAKEVEKVSPSVSRTLETFIDLAAVEKELEVDVNDDGLVALNKSARKLEVVLKHFDISKFDDKQVARLYSNYTDILSKLYIRIAQLETQLLELRQKRGELITTEESVVISEILVNSLYVNVDQLVQGIVDKAKEQEIEAHGKSKVDSEKLMDLAQELVDNFKRECHKSYEIAIPKALKDRKEKAKQ